MTTPATLRELPSLEQVLPQARSENFPVALRVLPPALRQDLLAVYAFARFVDDIGDELPGGAEARLAALDAVEAELDRAFDGSATHPAVAGLTPTITRRGLERQPFADLIAANRLDQTVQRYETIEQLRDYCSLSADPVGRIVLAVFGVTDDEAVRRSDLVCTGLQLVEHWQDVVEDDGNGRRYLPAEDLARFGVEEAELVGQSGPSPALRRLMAFEVGRARALLEEGSPLVGALRGWGRLAIGGFCGGGLAQVAALEEAGYDVFSQQVKASHAAVALATARLVLRGRA